LNSFIDEKDPKDDSFAIAQGPPTNQNGQQHRAEERKKDRKLVLEKIDELFPSHVNHDNGNDNEGTTN
jgi:hypothetical protein